MKRILKSARRNANTAKALPRNRGALALAHRHILAQVAAGSLPTGAALSEVSLAEQLGVSRTPVREAIGRLVAEGILQKTDRGAVVVEPTRQDIIELYELREALEVYSIGKVAEARLGARQFETLSSLVNDVQSAAVALKKSGKAALAGEALRKFIQSDLQFHMLLLHASGNQRMLKILDSTRLILRVFSLRREHHTAKLLEEIHRFHYNILNAVAAGRREEAMQLLGEHIRLSRDERLADYAFMELNESAP